MTVLAEHSKHRNVCVRVCVCMCVCVSVPALTLNGRLLCTKPHGETFVCMLQSNVRLVLQGEYKPDQLGPPGTVVYGASPAGVEACDTH